MFKKILNDSIVLRSHLEIPQDTLAVFSDEDQLFEPAGLSLLNEFSLGNLPDFPRAADKPAPFVRLYRGGSVPVLLVPSKPRIEAGYGAGDLAYGIRLLGQVGIRRMLFLDRAAWVHPEWRNRSDFFLIEDQANMMGMNPLTGPNHDEWGPRFPDMSMPFDPELSVLVTRAAGDAGVRLEKAVYAGFLPDQMNDIAECLLHMEKAHAVIAGTSLVQEVITARHFGIRVCALVYSPECPGVLPAKMLSLVLEGLSGLE